MQALDKIAENAGGPALLGWYYGITWADLCLAPLLSDFTSVPEGAVLLAACPRLVTWFEAFQLQGVFLETAAPSLAVARQSLQWWAAHDDEGGGGHCLSSLPNLLLHLTVTFPLL